jgi:hypothetical protein
MEEVAMWVFWQWILVDFNAYVFPDQRLLHLIPICVNISEKWHYQLFPIG